MNIVRGGYMQVCYCTRVNIVQSNFRHNYHAEILSKNLKLKQYKRYVIKRKNSTLKYLFDKNFLFQK